MKAVVLLILSLVTCLFIYKDSFNSYFFQDDWFTLSISKAANLADFLNYFVPRKDIIYYRPLGMQVPFFILTSLAGLNPLVFRILVFITHFINIFLVFLLSRAILKQLSLSAYVAFLYATSSVFFIPFYWASTYPFILGPTFFFLSLFFFIRFIGVRKVRNFVISFSAFILGLLINEMVITLPIIAALYLISRKSNRRLFTLFPYIFLAVISVIFRFIIFTPPTKGLYQMTWGWHILSNLKTYLFWSFNWSEVMTEQMIRPFIFNSLVTDTYSYVVYLSVITFFIYIFFMSIGAILFLKQRKPLKNISILFLGSLWFVTGLSPVILFPHHKFTYYLPISLVGFLIVSVFFCKEFFAWFIKKSVLLANLGKVFLLLLWIITSYVTLSYNKHEHWAPRRSLISRSLIEKVLNNQKDFITDYTVKIPLSSENKLALNDQDAFKLILGHNYSTVYEK